MYLTMKFFLKLTGLRVFLFIVPGLFVFFISSGKCVLSNNKSDVILARQLVDQSGIRGGLVVHLGSDDGLLTSELYVNESFVVHALNRDHALVEQSRNRLHDLGLYGPISVDHWSGERLPYADNLVNLIVVEDTGEIKMEEILRVLAPLGVALVKQFGEWTKTVKPWPEEIDEWTHYLYGPDNNAVSDDLIVGPPRRLQWVSPPRWSRIHDHLANLSAAVNAGGRLFYIMDKGPTADIAMPAEWTLISRDAFNGIHLWEKPMGEWEFRFRPFRTGPPDLTRRLVASGDLLYVTLGYGEPVVALDGATGENMHVYDQTVNSQEIIFYDGVLYLVIGEEPPDIKTQQLLHAEFDRSLGFHPSPYIEKRPRTQLMAVDAVTGKTLWHKKGAEVENIMPTTLAVADGYVFFQNTQHVICLETNGGSEIWRSDRPVSRHRRSWSAPTLVVYEGVVFSADRKVPDDQVEDDILDVQWEVTVRSDDVQEGEIIAFSADTGHRLWSAPTRETFHAPVDVLVAGGLVWTGNLVGRRDPGIVHGRDPKTGEIKRTRPSDLEFYDPVMGHARCYRNKATNRYLITGRSGVEFQDIESGTAIANHWVRGECQYGILPANGLLYAPPHPCACFILAKLNSFHALSSGSEQHEKLVLGDRLEKGSAFDMVEQQSGISGDWITYRHDASRSGRTLATVPLDLEMAWEKELKAPLTAPVAADGRLYVASREIHTLYALDAENGRKLWQFTAGGRVDSPPTIWNGRVFFGSADGWVYSLRATDGALVWRYHAASTIRMVGVDNQLESAWPVHGSVMVLSAMDTLQGVVYASAGRSSYLDGGIIMVRLDAVSGRELSREILDSRDPETGYQPHPLPQETPGHSMPGALNDILSFQNNSIFMRHLRFTIDGVPQADTEPHLHSAAGFLDDSWWNRTYWIAGDKMDGGWGYWPLMGNLVPSGRLLVLDGKNTYGYGRDRYHGIGAHVGLGGASYRLFAQSRSVDPRRHAEKEVFPWERRVDLYVRAMVLADRILFIAGPDDPLEAEDPIAVWEGRSGGLLWAVCADSGEKLTEYKLDAPPVFDGLIALPGRLLFSTTDGRVVSFAPQNDDKKAQR